MKTGKILDPIHGVIGMTEIEKFIINQKIFGRLRKVKQNTLLNYVFPGANHTRFEHSIGVMHLAEIILNNTNENVDIVNLKGRKYNEDKKYISVKKDINDEEKYNVILQELRIAALLHDVGHGPTSHKFDHFTIDGKKLIEILESEEEIFSQYLPFFKNYLQDKEDKKVSHELVSCVFIIKILTDLKNNEKHKEKKMVKDIEIKNILKMIEPNLLPEHKIKIGEKDYTDFFNSIISGFPFDADRMDYIYRDSFYSGVKYGVYDQSRILMSLLPVEIEGNKVTLGIKDSGLDSIIRIIQSRNHLYNQVYFHKTNCATNAMLDFIFKHFSDNNKSIIDANDYTEFEEFYCKNGDEYFFDITLRKKLGEEVCETCKIDHKEEECKEITVLDNLLNRELWKKCYEKKYDLEEGDEEEINNCKFEQEGLDELKDSFNEKSTYIQENYSSNKGLKDIDKAKSVLIKKDEIKNEFNTMKWECIEDREFKNLKKSNTFIKRVYVNNKSQKHDVYTKILELEGKKK